MPRRMYVHVGCPKTGTSYLQTIFWSSRGALRAQGVELPLDKASQFHVMLNVRELFDPDTDPPEAATALQRLASALPALSAPKALITQESLAPATPEQIASFLEMLKDFEVHVVITARDLARQLPSVWQQRLKKRLQVSYPDFCAAVRDGDAGVSDFWQSQDVAGIAARWGATLPADQVHVVTVPPPGAPADVLLHRFCAVLGCEPSGLQAVEGKPNQSLGAQQAELLRRVNCELGERLGQVRGDYRQVVKRYFVKHVLSAQDGRALVLPRELADWCREVSFTTVDRLQAGGYHVAGDVRDLLPAKPDADRTAEGGDSSAGTDVSDTDVAAAAVSALAELLVQRHVDQQQSSVPGVRPGQQRKRMLRQERQIKTGQRKR